MGNDIDNTAIGRFHHIELWVPDLARALGSWGWLLEEMSYTRYQEFTGGVSWRHVATGVYIVLEQSPDMLATDHDRHRPGLNHLAFHAGTRDAVERLTLASANHGWTLLFRERHPFAGGPDHYAAYLADRDGFEVELVAT